MGVFALLFCAAFRAGVVVLLGALVLPLGVRLTAVEPRRGVLFAGVVGFSDEDGELSLASSEVSALVGAMVCEEQTFQRLAGAGSGGLEWNVQVQVRRGSC